MPMKQLDATVSNFDTVFEKFRSEAPNNKANLILFLADKDPSTSLSWCPGIFFFPFFCYKYLYFSMIPWQNSWYFYFIFANFFVGFWYFVTIYWLGSVSMFLYHWHNQFIFINLHEWMIEITTIEKNGQDHWVIISPKNHRGAIA